MCTAYWYWYWYGTGTGTGPVVLVIVLVLLLVLVLVLLLVQKQPHANTGVPEAFASVEMMMLAIGLDRSDLRPPHTHRGVLADLI